MESNSQIAGRAKGHFVKTYCIWSQTPSHRLKISFLYFPCHQRGTCLGFWHSLPPSVTVARCLWGCQRVAGLWQMVSCSEFKLPQVLVLLLSPDIMRRLLELSDTQFKSVNEKTHTYSVRLLVMRIRENVRLAHSRCSVNSSSYPLSTLDEHTWKVIQLKHLFWEIMLENVSGHKLNWLVPLRESFLKPQKSFNPTFFLVVFWRDALSQEYEFLFMKSCFLSK